MTPCIGDMVSVIPHHNLDPEPKKLHIIPPPPPTQYGGDPFPKGSEVRSRYPITTGGRTDMEAIANNYINRVPQLL